MATIIKRISTMLDDDPEILLTAINWFKQHEGLLGKLCRRVWKHPSCNRRISHEDLMNHCLDIMPRIVRKYDPAGVAKLSYFIWWNCEFALRRFVAKNNQFHNKHGPITKKVVSTILDERLYTYDGEELAQRCFETLSTNLKPYELFLLVHHDCLGENFTQIAEQTGQFFDGKPKSRASVQRDYLSTLFKARRMMKWLWT